MSAELLAMLSIFLLAMLVGVELIGKGTLHIPLKSATNAIHGVILIGAMLVASVAGYALGFIAAAQAGARLVIRDRPRLLQGCGICVAECPCGAIDLVPEET